MANIQLMKQQVHTAEVWADKKICFNLNDPGTGKTIGTLSGLQRMRIAEPARPTKLLVFAPLSILEASWGDDIQKMDMTHVIAHGTPKKRTAKMREKVDVIVTNHDAVKWIVREPELLAGVTHIAIDESTAFKNHQTQRWQAMHQLIKMIPNVAVTLLTGTPNGQGVLDLWAQAMLMDGGERLGNHFFRFRATCCEPKQVGRDAKMIKWIDKEGALDYCMDKLKDIVVRYTLEECTDIPENHEYYKQLVMPPDVEAAYNDMLDNAVMQADGKVITALQAGVLAQKLLQILSGAVYDKHGGIARIHHERSELVIQLVQERNASLVAYNWGHELEALETLAKKEKIEYGVINGKIPLAKRTEYVNEFQAGNLQAIFAQPQAAGHGLTLTRGEATIWHSPTHSAELWTQFNRRVYRNGQTKKTETIKIAYRGSSEIGVYDKLGKKLDNMGLFLALSESMTKRSR